MPLTYPVSSATDITQGNARLASALKRRVSCAGSSRRDNSGVPFHPMPCGATAPPSQKIVRAGVAKNLCQRIILLFISPGISWTQIRGCCPVLSVHFHVSWLSVFTTVSMWNELTLAYSDRKCESTVPSRYISLHRQTALGADTAWRPAPGRECL